MTNTVEELMCDTAIPPKVVESPIRIKRDLDNVSSKLEVEHRRVPGCKTISLHYKTVIILLLLCIF